MVGQIWPSGYSLPILFYSIKLCSKLCVSHPSKWPSLKCLQITNAGEDVEKVNPPTLLVGM